MTHFPTSRKPLALDFFAGSGLATEALKTFFQIVWANDIDQKKADIYKANHAREVMAVGPIEDIRGACVPAAILSWASFPCQDLSLAGNLRGIRSARSGLVQHWLRVMDEMADHKCQIELSIESIDEILPAAGDS